MIRDFMPYRELGNMKNFDLQKAYKAPWNPL
jgi:hypothetical protein